MTKNHLQNIRICQKITENVRDVKENHFLNDKECHKITEDIKKAQEIIKK